MLNFLRQGTQKHTFEFILVRNHPSVLFVNGYANSPVISSGNYDTLNLVDVFQIWRIVVTCVKTVMCIVFDDHCYTAGRLLSNSPCKHYGISYISRSDISLSGISGTYAEMVAM